MSSCPALKQDLTTPLYNAAMKGEHGQPLPLPAVLKTTEQDPKLRLMWDQGCNPSNVFFSDGDHKGESVEQAGGWVFGSGHKVHCTIPESDWKKTWDSVPDKAKKDGNINPDADFLLHPIDWIRTELVYLVRASNHWWLEVDSPFDPNGSFGRNTADHQSHVDGAKDTMLISLDLMEHTAFIAAVIAVISMLFVAGRMALQRNPQPARELVRAMVTLVVVVAAGLAVIVILLESGDAFSKYFIVRTLEVKGRTKYSGDAACDVLTERINAIPEQYYDMNFFLFLLCAIFLLVASIVLYIYMLGRVFVVTLLAGLLPLAAAGTATQAGKEWFGKHVSYILAFVLIKPAATVVYVVALRLSTPDTDANAANQLTSAVFLCLGTVLLPAMTRLAFPFTSAAAQGDKGAAALATAPVAVGAKVVQSGISALRR